MFTSCDFSFLENASLTATLAVGPDRSNAIVPLCTMPVDPGRSSEWTVMWMEGSDGGVVSRPGEGVDGSTGPVASLGSPSTRRKDGKWRGEGNHAMPASDGVRGVDRPYGTVLDRHRHPKGLAIAHLGRLAGIKAGPSHLCFSHLAHHPIRGHTSQADSQY
jgi:hypothetical protein